MPGGGGWVRRRGGGQSWVWDVLHDCLAGWGSSLAGAASTHSLSPLCMFVELLRVCFFGFCFYLFIFAQEKDGLGSVTGQPVGASGFHTV